MDMIYLIGLGLWFVLVMANFYKKLRNDRTLFMLLIAAIILAGYGLFLRSPELQSKGANSADVLMCPLIYLLSYGTLRHIYKKHFGVEPTYNGSSWYDEDEGRKLNWADMVVFIFPMLFAGIFPILITAIVKL